MSHVIRYKLHDARECVLPPGNLWKPPASSTPFGSSPAQGDTPCLPVQPASGLRLGSARVLALARRGMPRRAASSAAATSVAQRHSRAGDTPAPHGSLRLPRPPSGRAPRRGYPLPPRTARKRAASRLCRVLALARRGMPRRAALHGRRRWPPPFTPSRGSCRAKVRPASGPTLAGRHAASSALSPAMLRLRRHIAGDMRSYTHFSALYPSASKKLTITKFEIWTMIFPFKVVHNSSSIKKFKTS